MKTKEEIMKGHCICKKPKEEVLQVAERLPGGFIYQHYISGNVCLKCGKLL